jgi:hypothetical protein
MGALQVTRLKLLLASLACQFFEDTSGYKKAGDVCMAGLKYIFQRSYQRG